VDAAPTLSHGLRARRDRDDNPGMWLPKRKTAHLNSGAFINL
jgi:hypothetical protein